MVILKKYAFYLAQVALAKRTEEILWAVHEHRLPSNTGIFAVRILVENEAELPIVWGSRTVELGSQDEASWEGWF